MTKQEFIEAHPELATSPQLFGMLRTNMSLERIRQEAHSALKMLKRPGKTTAKSVLANAERQAQLITLNMQAISIYEAFLAATE